jgi:hypothetical protein
LIGFFYVFFWHENDKAIRNNALWFFSFFGILFGISDEEHKKIILMKNQVTTIYKQAERFAEITKIAIVTGNINRAKKCLALAERLFETGSNETKNAISNVYVFSVSSFMELRHCSISNLFPKSLKAEYIKQINTSGV